MSQRIMAFEYDKNSAEHAHIRIDMLEEHSLKQDERHETTEKTLETLLKTIVANDLRKENNSKWYKGIFIFFLLSLIVYKVGIVEALKIWVGLV